MVLTTEAVVHYNYKSQPTLEKQDIPVDPVTGELDPDDVVIKTKFAALNPFDIKLHALTILNTRVHTLRDFSGTVVALGTNAAKSFAIGQPVWGLILQTDNKHFVGTNTLANLRDDVVAPLPAKLTLEQASAIPVAYGTAYQMLAYAESYGQKLSANSQILVLGAGTSVGVFLLQLAKKLFGVGKIVATASPRSAAASRGLGADEVIDYTNGALPEQFKQYAAINGKFDAILDCVGGYDAVSVYPDILKHSSTGAAYISVMGDGGPKATYTATILSALLALPRTFFRQYFGKYVGINYCVFLLKRSVFELTRSRKEWVHRAPEFFSIPGIVIPIDSVYPIADLKSAWAKQDSAKARGKIIVQF